MNVWCDVSVEELQDCALSRLAGLIESWTDVSRHKLKQKQEQFYRKEKQYVYIWSIHMMQWVLVFISLNDLPPFYSLFSKGVKAAEKQWPSYLTKIPLYAFIFHFCPYLSPESPQTRPSCNCRPFKSALICTAHSKHPPIKESDKLTKLLISRSYETISVGSRLPQLSLSLQC